MREIIRNRSEYCNICGLEISLSEYVLFYSGYVVGEDRRVKTQQGREDHCKNFHSDILKLQKEGKYKYEKAFTK